jgi:O-antigen/teichoic acid export membrane protein
MIFASGLGLSKTIILAKILSQENFGQYISISGAAILASTFLSFGLIEATTKKYPLLWVSGSRDKILLDARNISIKIFLMFVFSTTVGILSTFIVPAPYSSSDVILVSLLGFSSTILTIFASILRATESLIPFQNFNINRNITTLIFSSIGSFFLSLNGAIIGDLISSWIIILITFKSVNSIFDVVDIKNGSNNDELVDFNKEEGLMIYISNLCTSSTISLDRVFINASIGAYMAGSYGVLTLISQIIQLLVNIVGQGIGPVMIKSEYLKKSNSSRLIKSSMQLMLFFIISILLGICCFILKYSDIPSGFFEKYKISDSEIFLALCIGFLGVFRLLEFKLLSYHREKEILIASFVATCFFFLSFYVGLLIAGDLIWYLFCMIFTRIIHNLILLLFIKNVNNQNLKSENPS